MRGHPRIRKRSQQNVQYFIEQAAETFEELRRLPQNADRLFIIDGEKNAVIEPISKS